ncbi:TIGR02117 family protein [Erythrobacter ani]|uniref:TIGR02117 family protein n=1 Tax=Erythrobacter ani TaxID=2827235 RepID=A0ABS6SPF0_9SPHN|nr:TIGR02117 family protein [Erythrobacter ani]MBV7266892.1 TIGR02117 family protein [Erythrobacter ani]
MSGRSQALKCVAWAGAALLIAAPLLFFLSAWIGSSIPRNSGWREADQGIEIFIGENGIHTEIAMPVVTEIIDWRGQFPIGDIAAPARAYTHVAVSWGERAFFLQTPTWADLDLGVAATALVGGEGVLHVAWYVRPAPSDDFRPVRISREQYAALTREITAQLVPEEGRAVYSGYSQHDVFYDARGTYHLGNTCNQWTSERLASAGIATGWWTPLPGGVMKWVPPIGEH